MIIVDLISELSIIAILDRGKPNLERIILCPRRILNIGQYGLMLGIRGSEGSAIPIRDNFLWFGDAILKESDILIVFTDVGKATTTPVPNNDGRIIVVHWGRPNVILADQNIVPVLFRFDAVVVGQDEILPSLPTPAPKPLSR